MKNLFRWLIVVALLLHVVSPHCSNNEEQDCSSDAIQNENEWVRCKMCICQDFGDFTGTGHDEGCSGYEKRYYKCHVKYEDNNYNCKTKIKTDWLIFFIIISVGGACILCGLCGFVARAFSSK